MTRQPYTFLILRYRHDPASGEQLNVGVVLHSPKSQFLGARFRKAYGRVSKTFPDLDGATLRQDLTRIESAFSKMNGRESGDLFFGTNDASTLAHRIIGKDDGSLIWSEMGSGITNNAEDTLEALFTRFVTQYEEAGSARRTDADIWRPVRDRLLELKIASIFEKKTISSKRDEVEFEHAWKNGQWHCMQPLSFDLASADSIQEKAARWVGHMVGLSKSTEQFHPYFIVGRPADPALDFAYRRAVDFISDAPLTPTVIAEEDIVGFVDELADKVAAHERS